MTPTSSPERASVPARPRDADAALVLADGTVFWGKGFGAEGSAVGEICFNTSISGYQEILTDPSYAGQIITFTFPHIGNVGANSEDLETKGLAARGLVVRASISKPSNWRSAEHLDVWLKTHNIVGISGLDTRALTIHIRDHGAPNGVIAYAANGKLDLPALQAAAKAWPGLEGMDLAKDVTCGAIYQWQEGLWHQQSGSRGYHIVVVDYGAKQNILRCFINEGCRVTVVPATTTGEEILRLNPDGVFLSNGPGDPAATGVYAVPAIIMVMERNIPIFGICLGHQLLALAIGAKTIKMPRGHRGANHPVEDVQTGKVEITSQNHGFMVVPETLPPSAEVTHLSLFDGSNEGLRLKDKPVFSVQYHPEASPGPHDSHYLFRRFMDVIAAHKTGRRAA